MLAIAIASSFVSCYAQDRKQVKNKEFLVLLNRFRTVDLPLNYKKLLGRLPSMTHKEAIQFFHKKESDLFYMVGEMGEGEKMEYYKEDNSPACHFNYNLNDNIYILCTREGIQGIDTIHICLYSFTMQGKMIDRLIIGEIISYGDIQVVEKVSSFVLLDKKTIKVFCYENNPKQEKDFLSIVHHTNYQITDNGKFIVGGKSDVVYLKNSVEYYNNYSIKNEDDPMNEYDF